MKKLIVLLLFILLGCGRETVKTYSENGSLLSVLTFKNDTNGMKALQWWRDRCIAWCYRRMEDGKMGDQKYLDDWTNEELCGWTDSASIPEHIQKEINKRDSNSIRFLKTHSAPNDINGYKFTDLNNTMGVIHIVRDPRKIISSYANHASISKEDALKRLLEIRIIGGKNDPLNKTVIHVGSWLSNYNAWKEFKKVDKYLLVKYEDLISDPEKYFISILHFIEKISKYILMSKVKFDIVSGAAVLSILGDEALLMNKKYNVLSIAASDQAVFL